MFLLLMTNRRLSLAMTPRYGFRFTSVARRVWETQKEGAKVFAPSRERGNISNPEHHRLKSAFFGGICDGSQEGKVGREIIFGKVGCFCWML